MRTFNEAEALAYITGEVVWGNAAGTCKDGELAKKFAQAGMPHVMFGSITAEPRAGNAGDNFYYDEATGNSVNSWGIPNKGIRAYQGELYDLNHSLSGMDTRLWVSISAGDTFSPEEYQSMATILRCMGAAHVIEGNFSCPNMIVGGKPKPNVCYDLEAFTRGVHALDKGAGGIPTSAKLAPITEPVILRGLVEVCLQYEVDYIVVANTIGNCYIEKALGVPAITMVGGGLAGKGLRPVVKGMVRIIKPMLKGTHTKLIATAGVESGLDAYEFLALGADGFQFNTALSRRNLDPKVAQDIVFGDTSLGQKGLLDLLVEHGLPS